MNTDTLSIVGPPDVVTLVTETGATGPRGSLWFTGAGMPSSLTIPDYDSLKVGDMYVDQNDGGIYQMILLPSNALDWIKVDVSAAGADALTAADIGAATAAQGALADATTVEQVTLTAPLAYTLPAGIPANTVHRVTFTQDDTGGHPVTYGPDTLAIDTDPGASTLVEVWPGGTLVYPGAVGSGSLDTEGVQDVVGAMIAGAGGTYDDGAGTITLPSGGGPSSVTADDTPAAPAEGESASYLVTSAVVWPAGLVWSTDPDGGVTPIITGTALVSMFTVGGTTRAILGATFPAPVTPDVEVTATGPTWTDDAVAGGGTWTTPTETGITYSPASGTATGGQSVTVNATAASGYTITGTASWTHAFPADTTAPTWTATLTPGTPTETAVVVTASALATDANAVTYEVSYDNAATWAAIVPSGSNFTLQGSAGVTYATSKLRAKDAAGNYSTPVLSVPSYTMAASSDVTAPTVGTMAASAITSSGFTLTVSGAADETALHATPYAFTTDGGTTYSAYQASPVYATTGKTAETGYSCNWRVRDAEGNVSIGTAQTVTTGVQETLQEAILALSPAAYWPMKETSGTVFTDVSGNGANASFTAGVTLNQTNGHPTVSSAVISSPDRDAFTIGANGLTVFCLVRPSSLSGLDSSLITKGIETGTYEWALQYSSAQVRAETWTTDGLSISGQAKAKVLETNQWHLLAAAFNEGNTIDPFSLYIDSGTTQTGTTVKSNAGRVGQNTTSELYIARPGISGGIGHVAIFQDRLTDAQMQALYLAARSEGYLP